MSARYIFTKKKKRLDRIAKSFVNIFVKIDMWFIKKFKI